MKKDVLMHQLKLARSWIVALLDTVEKDELLIVPEGFSNNLHWQFGHVAATNTYTKKMLFKVEEEDEVAERFNKYFERGTSPKENFDDDTPTIEEVRELLTTQLDYFEEHLTDDILNTEIEENPFNAKNLGEMVGFFIIHESIHIGKIEEMKRVLKHQLEK